MLKNASSFKTAFLLSLLILFTTSVFAMPPSPELKQRLINEGRWNDFVKDMAEAHARGINNPERREAGVLSLEKAGTDAVDTIRVLVLLVDFSDHTYTSGFAAATNEDFDSLLFSTDGKNPTGSMTEFYLENSYGNMLIIGDVHGWYRLPQTYAYYVDGQKGFGSYPTNAQGMTRDAILAADADVDFSLYDLDNNGSVEGIFVVHSGRGYEESGSVNDIHSHQWSLGGNAVYTDGVTVSQYSTEPEENMAGIVNMGVFCHEYGHVLGLPDLYDPDYTPSTSDGLGDWSMMAGGSWNGDGRLPAHFDAWSKYYLGLVNVVNVTANMTDVEFPQVESEPVIYRVWQNGQTASQYFLVENRQKVGFDITLPGDGLVIYHVDETQWGNWNVDNYHVACEQADGKFQLEYEANDGDAGDSFPGASNNRSFDDLSTPNTRTYSNQTTQVSVWNISDSDSLMTANLDIEWSRPHFNLESVNFADNDGDNILESLETVQFYLTLSNDWKDANNINITMTSNDNGIVFTDPSSFISSISGGGTGDNFSDPIEFTVPSLDYPIYDSFFVTIESDGGSFQTVFGIEKVIGKTEILIVDDDRGSEYEDLYYDDLKKKLAPADIWEKSSQGSPSAATLNDYEAVIWFTGDTSSNLLSSLDVNSIKNFLDNGGNLFISGQGLGNELHNEDSTFLADYFHARKGAAMFNLIHSGVAGSNIADGFSVRYASGVNQEFTQSQQIEVLPSAQTEFNFLGGGPSALSYDGTYRLVYFNWGYEAISSSFSSYDTRDTVLYNILTFLTGWTPPPCIDTDGDGYGDPGNPENRCGDDNCPSVANEDQLDSDNDGLGNECDNCQYVYNPGQTDSDGDGIGDDCDNCATYNPEQADADNDGVGDDCDNCPNEYNVSQSNSDGDTFGDACDNCGSVDNEDQADGDLDDIGDACDNCLSTVNTDQSNSDTDALGDACDNCPTVDNISQEDLDSDTVGDSCDNCIDVYNPDQVDSNSNGAGDLCDMLCGDCNGDDGVNILDVTFIISYLYNDGPEPSPIEIGDVNATGSINILDITFLIAYLYNGGPEPSCL